MAASAGMLAKSMTTALLCRGLVGSLMRPSLVAATAVQPCRGMAARKGTREKARKKKVKIEIKKLAFDPLSQRDKKKNIDFVPKMKNDLWKQVSSDDVFPVRYYRKPIYTFEESIEMHRETHHPTVYNQPNALVKLTVELDLRGEKKTRFLDKIFGIAELPHSFDQQIKRTIIMFTKKSEEVNAGLEAGAAMVGGTELIKNIQTGEAALRNVDYVVCTNEILADLTPLRGLFKRQFPNNRNGTLTDEPVESVKRLMNGLEYVVLKDDNEPEYGWFECNIGTLGMPTEQLKANMMALLNDAKSKAPAKKKEPLVWRLSVSCLPGGENFKLDLFKLLGIKEESSAPKEKEHEKPEKAVDEDDDEKVAVKQ